MIVTEPDKYNIIFRNGEYKIEDAFDLMNDKTGKIFLQSELQPFHLKHVRKKMKIIPDKRLPVRINKEYLLLLHRVSCKYCKFDLKNLGMCKFFCGLGIILMMLLSPALKAQEKTIHGMIVVDFKTETPEGVFVTNLTSGKYDVTDLTGSFKINAAEGDTLFLRGLYLQDRKFAVRKSSFQHNPLVIHMNYEVITLQDLVVKAPLTGNLQNDVKSVKIRDDQEKLYANLGIDIRTLDMVPKEKKEEIVPLGVIPIPTSLNVEALYKSLTGYYRRMENLNQFEKLEKRLNDVRDYLGIKYFQQTLGIRESDIHGFLLYAYDHSDNNYEYYYLNQDYLNMDKLLRSLAPEFRTRIEQRDSGNP